jgi:hypothetical protein
VTSKQNLSKLFVCSLVSFEQTKTPLSLSSLQLCEANNR